jgi:hypothetical protein
LRFIKNEPATAAKVANPHRCTWRVSARETASRWPLLLETLERLKRGCNESTPPGVSQMNIHSSIAWFFLNVVGIVVAAIVVFDVVNLARKAAGRALMLPQVLVMPRARSTILIGILLLLAATVAFAVAAGPG